MMLVAFTVSAQTVDSTYTVPPPPDYVFPFVWDENEIVKAAASENEKIFSLNFDTTAAYHIRQSSFELDYIPHVPSEIMQQRLQVLEKVVPLHFNDRVRAFIDYFTVKDREFILRMLQRKNIFFPLFERILKEEGLPEEIKYLSIVESALNPYALSRAGAKGLWQFMHFTGRQFGLKQDYYLDERMNPEKSTRAACRYLKELYHQFNDWELAIAAYNCGPGNIRKAQRKSGKFHFWDIYHNLPQETRSYLPQLVAIIYTMNYAEEHNIIQEHPYLPIPASVVYVNQPTDLRKIAKHLNVCYDDLLELNAELSKGIIPSSARNYPLWIPSERLLDFLNRQEEILAASKFTGEEYKPIAKNHGNYLYHVVSKGETLSGVAQKYGVRLSSLKEWNNMTSNFLRTGQKIIVYSPLAAPKKDVPVMAKTQTKPLLPQKVSEKQESSDAQVWKSTYVVQSGDTLWSIAQKFEGLTVQRIKQLNQLRSNKLTPGQKLRVK